MSPSRDLDRLARLVLLVEVDRRVDDEAAELDDARAVLLDQLVLDVVEEVALAAAAEVVGRVDAERAADRALGGALGDHPELRHLAQDLVAAALGGRAVGDRRVQRGRLRQAGEQRRLVQVEVLRALVEVDPGGRLGADRGLAADRAVRDGVEVLLEDPLLRVLVLELLGELRLADLALVAGQALARLVGGVEVADELHADRRAALHDLAAGEVLDRGADDALVVDALVAVEALVLDRDRGLAQHLRQRFAGHRAAELVGGDEAEAAAVGRQDLGVRARVALLERRELRGGGGGGDDEADHRDAGRARDDEDHQQGDQGLVAVAAAATTASPIALRAAHRRAFARRREPPSVARLRFGSRRRIPPAGPRRAAVRGSARAGPPRAPGARPGRRAAADREPDAGGQRLGDADVGARLVAQQVERALRVGARRDPDRHVEPDDVDRQRVVLEHAARPASRSGSARGGRRPCA